MLLRLPVSILVPVVLVFLAAVHPLMGNINEGATDSDYIITKRVLSIESGLASHEVFCGLQDSLGFLWLGTRNGLNRYDGENMLLFTKQRKQLQDNKIVQLAYDGSRQLFIEYGNTGFQLTTNGKVDVMDVITHKVKTLSQAFPNLPFQENDVYWIANDGTDEVCFMTSSPYRLWKYSNKNGFRLHLEMKEWDKIRLNSDYRTTGSMCTFQQGMAIIKLNNQEKQYFVSGNDVVSYRQNNVLRSLPIAFPDKNKAFITYNTFMNPDAFVVGEVTKNGEVSTVRNLQKYHLSEVIGRYWFQAGTATDGAASFFYNANEALYIWNKRAFLKVLDKSELKGFENLAVYKLFPDGLGNLWLCTSLGLIQLTLKRNRFKHYFTTRQQTLQANNQVRGIYAEPSGKILANIWTDTFQQDGSSIQMVRHDAINYALVKHNSKLYSGGVKLTIYDEQNHQVRLTPAKAGSEIWSMLSLNDSLLLLGRTYGFSLYNSRSNRLDSLPFEKHNTPVAQFVYRLFRDKKNNIWAVAENGLFQLQFSPLPQLSTSLASQWKVESLRSGFLQSLILMDAYREDNGTFWLATNGEGLYRWDPLTNAIKQFNITAGFPSDVLYRIESDTFGNLWISSDYGLIRFNLNDFSVNTYTTIDGISHNEFNRTSSFSSSDGMLYFGGLNGINAFHPADFRSDKLAMEVPFQIISFNQFVGSRNELIDRTTELLNSPSIILEPADKFFTLDFQLLDFTKNEGHRYAYKIAGVDESWNYINENSVRISGLPYGKYTLRIKAQNREGVWNKIELSIPITVLKPLYLHWGFILPATLAFLLAIYVSIQLRIRKLARDKKKLEATVEERTTQLKKSLSEQSALLSEKDVLMKEIHHRVKNNLQVISGLLELQSKTLADSSAREALREGRNRVRSIALIHQNLYQFENLSSIDLKRFVTDLCCQVQSIYTPTKTVAVEVHITELHLDIDSGVPVGLILTELLSNSFKYAFNEVREGNIIIKIETIEEGRFLLTYSDNGPGLPPDDELAKTKTLGLQLINDLTRQIGGHVQYATKQGAFFSIIFTNRDLRKLED
ncbi:histidine kinase dimerization/phosphoacceptor domain -containing protein [Dyadobacter tibetensis]|uniref:histidine kinase dimerization/phosphoacceptor domain -containing protein n=1 Tax=Dyadobacter tibetensis TaxID=1211851 RepID=UPI000471AD7A|nr:histidine kinase dimerization/phosphoacceptor domain -containing protein [Dyadobacter tibetensis]